MIWSRPIFSILGTDQSQDRNLQRPCNVKSPGENNLGSIASTGFGLTALCIGEKRGTCRAPRRKKRALDALNFLEEAAEPQGFFYHWADINTGERL